MSLNCVNRNVDSGVTGDIVSLQHGVEDPATSGRVRRRAAVEVEIDR